MEGVEFWSINQSSLGFATKQDLLAVVETVENDCTCVSKADLED